MARVPPEYYVILQRDPRDPDDPAPRKGGEGDAAEPNPGTPDGVEWTPFDPGDAPELPTSADGAGRVVAMIASTGLVGAGWAMAVASELARVWAAKRPGVVLVDTDLERPGLHDAARVDNAMGLAEVLRGEVPVSDATRVVEADRLFCVPAGNALEEPASGFDATRWSRLCRAFSDAGVTVVAYVPVQAPWLDAVLDVATDVVLLTEQDRRLEWPNRDDAPPLRAVLGPMLLKDPPPESAGRPRGGSAALQGFDLPDESPETDDRGMMDRAADDREKGATGDAQPSLSREESVDVRMRRGRRRVAVVALLVAIAAVAWAVARTGEEPGMAQSQAPDAAESSTIVPASDGPAASTARPVTPAEHFSVGVASFTDATRADEQASRLMSTFSDLSWMVAPVEVAGTVYHRVLGGVLPDSAAALGVAAELARGGLSDWVIRRSGWVVELGTWATLDEAENQRAAARADGIPAYLSRFRLADGSERYAVYVGAYADEQEAGYLVGRARTAGFEAHVVPRLDPPIS